jgi:hypothetical protein
VEVKIRAKTILLNCGIATGLGLQIYWRKPFYLIVIAGVVLFTVANVILLVKYKKAQQK